MVQKGKEMNCKNCGAPLEENGERMIFCVYCKTRTRNPHFNVANTANVVVNTGGGAHIAGSINVTGDFTGRDQTVIVTSPRNKDRIITSVGKGASNIVIGTNNIVIK